jgi:hypothetical protein
MRIQDLFDSEVRADAGDDPWGLPPEPVMTLRVDLLEATRRGPIPGVDDLDLALPLAQLVHDDLERFATGGGERLNDDEMALAIMAVRAVLRRLDLALDLPFRNLTTFRTHWIKEGLSGSGSWQARREFLNDIFEPIHAALLLQEERRMDDSLIAAISPRGRTGWAAVDAEIAELRRRFSTASSPQDYRAVGVYCVGVLEALARTVYDPAKHLRPGEEQPPPDKTKQRLDRYVDVALGGQSDEELRAATRKIIDLAQCIKHRQSPTRRDAGIAGDAVILLANMLRRLDQEF